jgi:hypothetical protein
VSRLKEQEQEQPLRHQILRRAMCGPVLPLLLDPFSVLQPLALPQQLGLVAIRVRQRDGARGQQMGRQCSTNDF